MIIFKKKVNLISYSQTLSYISKYMYIHIVVDVVVYIVDIVDIVVDIR